MAKWQEAPGEGAGRGGDKALEGAQPLHGAQAIRLGGFHRNRPCTSKPDMSHQFTICDTRLGASGMQPSHGKDTLESTTAVCDSFG